MNTLNEFIKRVFGGIIYSIMNKEDPVKVQNYINWLSKQTPGHTWVALNGLNALTTSSYNVLGALTFNGNIGTPIKAFLNQNTGEIRIIDARYIYKV